VLAEALSIRWTGAAASAAAADSSPPTAACRVASNGKFHCSAGFVSCVAGYTTSNCGPGPLSFPLAHAHRDSRQDSSGWARLAAGAFAQERTPLRIQWARLR